MDARWDLVTGNQNIKSYGSTHLYTSGRNLNEWFSIAADRGSYHKNMSVGSRYY